MVATRLRVLVVFVLPLGLCACGERSSSPEPAVMTAHGGVSLRVFQVRTPALRVPDYTTRGAYPQVRAAGEDLGAVNAGLRAAFLGGERAFSTIALQQERAVPADPGDPGQFETSPRRSLTSASSVVVSTLIPAIERFPGGNDGGEWLSATVRVPSGTRVEILDLFSPPSRGLAALARAARKYGVANNRCVAYSVHSEFGRTFLRRFSPTLRHYRNFALLPDGLAVGFGTGEVTIPTCGRILVTVPYRTLRPYLSELGRTLTAAVRPPRP